MESKMFYTVKEFAEILEMSELTIRRYIKSGRINAFKPGIGKRADYRINHSEFQRLQDIGFEDNLKSIEEYIKTRN